MKGFFERLQWKIAAWMEGRYGTDGLSNFLMIVAVVFLFIDIFLGSGIFSMLALVLLALALFRSFSKNHAARASENDTYERIVEKPKREVRLLQKKWKNRETTIYFKCKGCGQVLSVPKGKGTLRVVCPKCKTETTRKS